MPNYRITIPHAGDYYIAFSFLFKSIGYEVLMPPKTTQDTLSTGVRLAPSQACLPFKVTIGNLVEALDLGANVIAMIGGRTGICRLAYYTEAYKKILYDQGYEFEVVNLKLKKEFWVAIKRHFPELTFRQFGLSIARFWKKMTTLEYIRQQYLYSRPHEINSGHAFALKQKYYEELDKACTIREIKSVKRKAGDAFQVVRKEKKADVIRIGLVGEFYLLVDEFSTLFIEDILSELGAEVESTLTFSEFFIGSIKQVRFLDNFLPTHGHKINKLAKPYVNRAIGGHARQSIGETIRLCRENCDAIIHIYPFSCMPEIVASSLLNHLSHDLDTPILSLSFDEHTGVAGLRTRLEAVIDMIRRKRAGDNSTETPTESEAGNG